MKSCLSLFLNIEYNHYRKTIISPRLGIIVLLFLLIPVLSFSQKAIPELWGFRVHDEVNILHADSVDALEKKLKAYEDSTSNQIAVLIISSLDGEDLEDYSIRVANAWKLGVKGKDNGVLLLIIHDDHKIRIEVGRGLEGAITDAHCSRIIRNEITPHFRRNEYEAGVAAAMKAIVKTIGGEYEASDTDSLSSHTTLLIFAAILLFLLPTIYSFYKEFRAPSNNNSPLGKRNKSSGSNHSVSSSGWSNSKSGFSSSGSSFSGGGGRFGGGGASGSW